MKFAGADRDERNFGLSKREGEPKLNIIRKSLFY
jgi:hypothetical protein